MRRSGIIGAGVTGLAAAWQLDQRSDRGDRTLTFLDAAPAAGGKIHTVEQDGFRFERGPDSFISQKPWLRQWCEDLGVADQLVGCLPENNRVLFFHEGRLLPMPDGFRLCAATKVWPILKSPLLSLPAKLRLLREPWIPARTDGADESMADFITRRFGRETLDRMAGPLMAGIFVGDPETLSITSTFPMMRDLEKQHGSVTRGLIHAAAARQGTPPQPTFLTFRNGLQTLRDTVVDQLATPPALNEPVASISREGGEWILEHPGGPSRVEDLLLSVSAPAAARLLRDTDPELADALAGIRQVSSAAISLGFQRDDLPADLPIDCYGVMIPRDQRRHLLAVSWTSSKFADRAPEGYVLARMFVGGDGHEAVVDEDDETLVRYALEDLDRLMGLQAKPVLRDVHRWIHASPQYEVSHADRVARIRKLAGRHPGLALLGTCYDGVGLPDCVHAGRTWARNLEAVSS